MAIANLARLQGIETRSWFAVSIHVIANLARLQGLVI